MPNFGAASLRQIATCDPRLQALLNKVIQVRDCTVLEGKRSEEQQRINVAKGVSKTMQSKHVYPLDAPSLAADVAPYPIRWPKRPALDTPPELMAKAMLAWAKDMGRFYYFAGYVQGVAREMGLQLRYGGDWDGDHDIHEQSFDDLPHFEIVD